MKSPVYDILIIGAGIVGAATAYHLIKKQPSLKIAILEKEASVSFHQSDRNSGVIHSGVYYEPGSAKAINCQKGYKSLLEFCSENDVDFDLCGKVIVANDESELATLDTIFKRGKANGLESIKYLDPQQIAEIEPYVKAIKGIHVPQAGIIDYLEVTQKITELFVRHGGEIFLLSKVLDIRQSDDLVEVICKNQTFKSKALVNCAGLYADKVAEMTGMKADFKIVPFRGEFYRLKKEKEYLVNGLIYPVPDMKFPFLGVHFTKRLRGGIEAGPNAVLSFRREGYKHLDIHPGELFESVTYPGFLRLASKFWKKGFEEMHRSFSPTAFVKSLQRLIPEIKLADIERSRSGVRAQALDRQGNLIYDYFILENEHITNLCNAPSPAATSGLAIGDFLSQKVLDKM
jgi:L-2-hydroxyglutarate oxidase